jgi:hypothetical protein
MICVKKMNCARSPEEYLKFRMANYLDGAPDHIVTELISAHAAYLISNDSPQFLPVLTGSDGADCDEVIADSSAAASQAYPLCADETIVDEELWIQLVAGAHAHGSPVFLRQETNLAEVFIPIAGKLFKDGAIVDAPGTDPQPEPGLSEIESETSVEASPEANIATSPAHLLALAKLVGGAILDAAGSYVWDRVKKEVLNIDDLPSYYIKVYEELRRIIDANFERHNMTIMRSIATAFDLAITDWNATRNPPNFYIAKDKIFDLVAWSHQIGHAGTFGYAEATVLHIMTLQEEYVEAKRQGRSADDLKRIRVHISKTAQQYAASVRRKHDALIADRMAAISPHPYEKHMEWFGHNGDRRVAGILFGAHSEWTDERGHPNGCFRTLPMQYQFTGWVNNRFDDNRNGFWHSVAFGNWQHEAQHQWKISWTLANNALQHYRKFIHERTFADLEALRAVAAVLDALVDRPVGKE